MSNNVTSQSSENINKVEAFYQQPDKKSNIADMYSNQSIQEQASTNSQSTVFSTTNVNSNLVNQALSTDTVNNQQSNVNNDDQIDTL